MTRTQLLDSVLLLSHLVQLDQERTLVSQGLTASRTAVLWNVHHGGPQMQRDLARALDVSPRHVTTLVDELIDLGYAERREHPHDRRAVLVVLTDRGEKLMREMDRQHRDFADALTEGWSDVDVEAARHTLDALAARLAELMRADAP